MLVAPISHQDGTHPQDETLLNDLQQCEATDESKGVKASVDKADWRARAQEVCGGVVLPRIMEGTMPSLDEKTTETVPSSAQSFA